MLYSKLWHNVLFYTVQIYSSSQNCKDAYLIFLKEIGLVIVNK